MKRSEIKKASAADIAEAIKNRTYQGSFESLIEFVDRTRLKPIAQ